MLYPTICGQKWQEFIARGINKGHIKPTRWLLETAWSGQKRKMGWNVKGCKSRTNHLLWLSFIIHASLSVWFVSTSTSNPHMPPSTKNWKGVWGNQWDSGQWKLVSTHMITYGRIMGYLLYIWNRGRVEAAVAERKSRRNNKKSGRYFEITEVRERGCRRCGYEVIALIYPWSIKRILEAHFLVIILPFWIWIIFDWLVCAGLSHMAEKAKKCWKPWNRLRGGFQEDAMSEEEETQKANRRLPHSKPCRSRGWLFSFLYYFGNVIRSKDGTIFSRWQRWTVVVYGTDGLQSVLMFRLSFLGWQAQFRVHIWFFVIPNPARGLWIKGCCSHFAGWIAFLVFVRLMIVLTYNVQVFTHEN